MLTHGNMLGEVEAVFAWADIGPSDAVLGILPLFHSLAQMANLLLPLMKGARVVYLETLNTTELLRALRERSISVFAVVPQFFYLIHERIFKQANKRGAMTVRLLRGMMRLNRWLRKLGINAGPILFGKIHETSGGGCVISSREGRALIRRLAMIFTTWGLISCRPMGSRKLAVERSLTIRKTM